MNKTISNLFIGMAALGFQACDSLFDNELPKHDLVDGNAIVDEKTAETALNGVYSYLDESVYGGELTTEIILYNNIRLNTLANMNPGSFEKDQLLKMEYDETDNNFEGGWENAYKMVNAANNVIAGVERLPENKFSLGRKNEILGEARFMRAFANMYLMETYSQFWDIQSPYGLVLRLEPSVLSNNTMPRQSVDSSYNAIFNDLDFAIQHGPDFYSSYRGSKITAKAFKANWLMARGTQADREEAFRLADEVLAADTFRLEKNYADIFLHKSESPEVIFASYTSKADDVNTNKNGLLQRLGSGQYQPKEYTPEDDFSHYSEIMNPEDEPVRYKASLDTVFVENGNPQKRLGWIKFYTSEGTVPMYYLRLAQLHLVKAETMVYLDGYTVADIVNELNVLRGRAQATLLDTADYTDKEELLEEILKEYLRELSMENGDAFFYAARTIVNGERLLKSYNTYFTKDTQLCFPIPAEELRINFLAKQNPY